MITAAQIREFAPRARADIVAALVAGQGEMRAAGIVTPLRLQHFMAQIHPETGGLRFLEENLNYSAKRLMQVWPARFRTLAAAQPFANNPEALANKVYGGRLGNTQPGDGWRYRGRGMKQTTGRFNYRAAGHENDPDALLDPVIGLRAALTFWKDNGCNAIADRDKVVELRKRVNGGTNGLDDARDALSRAKLIFTEAPGEVGATAPPEAPARQRARRARPAPPANPPAIAEPSPAPITDEKTVRRVQEQLRALGYVEVGTPDGKIGRYTKGAIAAYRIAKGLPPGDAIDDTLILALAKDDTPAEVSPERANADAARVQAVAPEARPTWCAKIWSGIAGFVAFLGTIMQGVLSQFETAKGYLAPVQEMLADVPPWAWCAIAAGIAFYIWRASATAEAAITEAVQTGARR